MNRASPRARHLLAVLLAAPGLAACTSGASQPKVSDFAAGACRAAAPVILDVGRRVRAVHDGSTPKSVEPALTRDQARLRALPSVVDPALRGRLTRLAVSIGFFRLLLDSDEYSSGRLSDVDDAQRAVIRFCTKGSS